MTYGVDGCGHGRLSKSVWVQTLWGMVRLWGHGVSSSNGVRR